MPLMTDAERETHQSEDDYVVGSYTLFAVAEVS